MKFSQAYQVKWHDTDANRQVRPSQILMYMQETANEQLRNIGLSLDALRDRKGLAFLLSNIAVRIYAPLYALDQIEVQTWVCEGKGLSYNRCFQILRGNETVAVGSSVWGLLDIQQKRLLRVEEAPYDLEPEPFLQIQDLPRRLRVPRLDDLTCVGERKIVYSDIDYNGHMNNTHYPDMFCDFTPDIRSQRVSGFMLSFLHEATFDYTLKVYHAVDQNDHYFKTIDDDGRTCTEALLKTVSISMEEEKNEKRFEN